MYYIINIKEKTMRKMYFVKADHPVLRRIDKWVKPEHLNQFFKFLIKLGYEKISVDYVEGE